LDFSSCRDFARAAVLRIGELSGAYQAAPAPQTVIIGHCLCSLLNGIVNGAPQLIRRT
jgi:hypothetical protein